MFYTAFHSCEIGINFVEPTASCYVEDPFDDDRNLPSPYYACLTNALHPTSRFAPPLGKSIIVLFRTLQFKPGPAMSNHQWTDVEERIAAFDLKGHCNIFAKIATF